ncbi:MAG: transcription-repair coupling factor [Clostridium sp.]|jgi:transcription-repair coupling factor (superfamily II helicase)|nr:transcription-repair coupling factor [Clostridium sp.]
MQALLAPLRELAEYDSIRQAISKEGEILALTGVVDSAKLHMAYALGQNHRIKVIVTHNDLRAKEIYEEYKFYDRRVMLYPAKDLIFFQADIQGNVLTKERVALRRRLFEGGAVTLVTTFAALMTPIVPWNEQSDILKTAISEVLDMRKASEKLVEMGYERHYQVESPGQFSLRGGILDVYDLTEENPVRIELWGDEVESIRSFDVLSQRSIENMERITIYPAAEFVLTKDRLAHGRRCIEEEGKQQEALFRKQHLSEEAHSIHRMVSELLERLDETTAGVNLDSYLRYFYEEEYTLQDLVSGAIFFMDEPKRIEEHAAAVEYEFGESMQQRLLKGYLLPGQAKILYSAQHAAAKVAHSPIVLFSSLEGKNALWNPTSKHDISVRNISSYNNSFETLVKDLKTYRKNGYRVLLLSGSRTRAMRLAQDLTDMGLTGAYTDNPDREVLQGEVLTYYGHVAKGFEYPLLRFVCISETDIFGAEKKKKKHKKIQNGLKINDFHELVPGDYVVHESHGLGIYRGIEKIRMENVIRDCLKIEYRDAGVLYIPATGLDVIQKYASSEAKTPKLNRLGSKEWEKTKAKVKSAVGEVARDLVELYALRQQTKGYIYGKDSLWQKEFEEMFPFEETQDQLTAIEETKADMESEKIMDRLICGDVGYGKTEIAIRAAFKAVQEGKQVAYLVPTTILAQQHYNTFAQRMKDYPMRIELLSRFRTQAEMKRCLIDLKKGMVDIVIGTHRLLSADVAFKDLGLLVIDEEQRFGVTHKEKIKKLKENVDVLTLTATPIPRTLHMSLIGIRDMSILEEPPQDRLPIQTYVMEYHEEMVREAIVRELAREGQVFYVYNRVQTIADVTAKIAALVPEATVAFAHGQMNERELERIMVDFISGEIDVLVSTTIIETGLDISNVNTMIIHDSDNMGLAQLYQLRGRVGRSNRTAYAFLMYKRDKLLKEVAEKRLSAIKEFTDLGSGFKIAMRDLEIRGAGNLLGVRQHGHMEAVGYDLYCKMLNDAVRVLKGAPAQFETSATVDLHVDAFIPPEYIVNEVQKLDIYKRITGIENNREKEEMKDELLDRFGAIPQSVDNLLRIALIRVAASRQSIAEIKGRAGKIVFQYEAKANVDPLRIPGILARDKDLTFTAYGRPSFTYIYPRSELSEIESATLLNATEKVLLELLELQLG